MRVSLFLAAASVAFGALAQLPAESSVDSLNRMKAASTRVIYVDGRPETEEGRKADLDSLIRVMGEFYYDQFRNFQDPDAPYFMMLSKDADLAFGVGGGVRMRAFYGWDGAIPANAFSPMLIPIPANPASPRQFNATPSGTYLFFRAMGHNGLLGNYQLYIEADFTGYQGRDFKLKNAYATVGDFTLGYAPSTFSDPAALPPVIDAAGVNNKLSATTVLVRYMPTIKTHWNVGVSVETPETAISYDNKNTTAATSWLPDFGALVQYQWARGQHVRLSGILRTLAYRNIIEAKNKNIMGWGMLLSSVAHPLKKVTTYLNLNYGRGYANLGGDMMYGGGYDLVGDPDNPGTLYAPKTLGWSVGLQYNFTPTIFATASVSETRYLPDHPVLSSEYKYGVFACANIFWFITPRVSVIAEYDWGKRKNVSGASNTAQRANLSASFTF